MKYRVLKDIRCIKDFLFRYRYLPHSTFYIKAVTVSKNIFGNFMNWYDYLFNLAGYPAIFRILYPAGYPEVRITKKAGLSDAFLLLTRQIVTVTV
jgi:hypothetical protein